MTMETKTKPKEIQASLAMEFFILDAVPDLALPHSFTSPTCHVFITMAVVAL